MKALLLALILTTEAPAPEQAPCPVSIVIETSEGLSRAPSGNMEGLVVIDGQLIHGTLRDLPDGRGCTEERRQLD